MNIGGNTYENVSLVEYSSGMYEGQRSEIMYLPDKPGKAYGKIGLWLIVRREI